MPPGLDAIFEEGLAQGPAKASYWPWQKQPLGLIGPLA